MAVVQISRIQIRRGQKNQGAGLPQLASGELGWAIDTQEMYIGNGSVAEGAPLVGNTKILTENDNLFDLANSYAYKENIPYIITGSSANNPIRRTLQQRLDDRLSIRSFGVEGDDSTDCTLKFQQAIDQTFINPIDKDLPQSKVILHLEPGVYVISSPIYIPSYVTLKGAGPGKTIIRQITNNPIFQTVNSDSEPQNPSPLGQTTSVNQNKNLWIESMTLENLYHNTGILFDATRDSYFSNVEILGPWTIGDSIDAYSGSGYGVNFNALSGAIKNFNIKFSKCLFNGWGVAVLNKWDNEEISFIDCVFKNCGYGVTLGHTMVIDSNVSLGRSIGPTRSSIKNCIFDTIARIGVWIEYGKTNLITGCTFKEVGNEGGGELTPSTPIIKIDRIGNLANNNFFERAGVLNVADETVAVTVPYIPEYDGIIDVEDNTGYVRSFGQTNVNGVRLCRLPGVKNQSFIIEYQLISQVYDVHRVGSLSINMENRGLAPSVSIVDDYNYTGDILYEDYVDFFTSFDQHNAIYDTVSLYALSNMPSNDTSIFKFAVKFKITNYS